MANNRHRRIAKLKNQERIRELNKIKTANLEVGRAIVNMFSGFKKALDNAIQLNVTLKGITKTNKITEVEPWHHILPPPDYTADLYTPMGKQKRKSIES